MYFIKNGQIEWEGKVVAAPIKSNGMVYAVSDDYIFAATLDGPVMWKVKMINDGKISLRDDAVVVTVKGQEVMLNLKNGEELK